MVRATPPMAAPVRMALVEVGQELGPGAQAAQQQPREHSPRKGRLIRGKLAELSLILSTLDGEQKPPA